MISLYLMVGLPASGKSTKIHECQALLESLGMSVAVISRDKIRYDLVNGDKDQYFSKEKEVFRIYIEQINEAIDNNINDIFLDATHISKASRKKVLRAIKSRDRVNFVVIVMQTSIDNCKILNHRRHGFDLVPDTAIDDMYKRFEYPTAEEFEEFGFRSVNIIPMEGV